MSAISRPPPRWVLIAAILGVLVSFALAITTNARAQSLDRLDAHQAPDLTQAAPSSDGGVMGWLDHNKTWLLLAFALLGAVLVVSWILRQNTSTKKLQRDALERLRQSLLESCKATRGPAKTVWTTGSPRDPPAKLGRYAGHYRSVEAVWVSYRTWLFGQRRLVCVNPVDLNGLDAPEVTLRAIAVNITRGLGTAVPDTHNSVQRQDWEERLRIRLATPEAFAEAWKAYYARAVDNAIAFYDAMNASEDRSFLRQEITRSQDELTETTTVAKPATTKSEEATTDG